MTQLAGPTATRTVTATAFGTFGELLQGALPDGRDFLVTLPIARWSTAWFAYDPNLPAVEVRPAHKVKSRLLAERMLARRGCPGGGTLLVDSQLPEGKGLASSSADLVATARAVGRALGAVAEPDEVEDLMRGIEPSDGVMYPGVVAFHHREVRLRARLGHLPPLSVVGVDEGGEIDTVAFNRRPKSFSAAQTAVYGALLDTLTDAIRRADAPAIGAVATRSAELNQRLCPKRNLDAMIAICREHGGLGVVAAHSGTALGILLAADARDHPRRLARVRRACAALTPAVWTERCLPGPNTPGHPPAG